MKLHPTSIHDFDKVFVAWLHPRFHKPLDEYDGDGSFDVHDALVYYMLLLFLSIEPFIKYIDT